MIIKLFISYKGTRYSGWQVQKNAPTVQKTLQDSIEQLLGYSISLTGCSRTDSGVHANIYCCSVDTNGQDMTIPMDKLPIALNHRLPSDISALQAEAATQDFHPRYDIKYKEYEYLIWNEVFHNPFLNDSSYHYPKHLDEKIMNDAAKLFVGRHDFSSFMSSGSDVEDCVRNILYFNVTRDGSRIKINVAADGFLYNMVRILTGTLIEVAEGKIKIEDIPFIIESKNRRNAGFTAPAQGLYLNKVVY